MIVYKIKHLFGRTQRVCKMRTSDKFKRWEQKFRRYRKEWWHFIDKWEKYDDK